MPNKQKNTSASQIRRALDQIGWNALPKEIIAHLKAGGIEVTPQQVSNEKAKRAKQASPLDLDDLPVSFLKKVRALVDEVGSTDLVRRALDELDVLSIPVAGRRAPASRTNAGHYSGQRLGTQAGRRPTGPQDEAEEEQKDLAAE